MDPVGRVPHQRHRRRTSELLEVEESALWPGLFDGASPDTSTSSEIVAVYPHRGAVPHSVWRRLVEDSQRNVDILVYAGLFLIDSNPDLPNRLIERAGEGLQARLLFGDPDSDVVAWRGDEEGIGSHLAARIRLSLTYLEPTLGVQGIDVRQHHTVLYNSLYRFDDELLVNTHVMGSPAPQNPVIHVRRVAGGRLFDHYLASFGRAWESAVPVSPRTAEAASS
jgi:hypothetical protein